MQDRPLAGDQGRVQGGARQAIGLIALTCVVEILSMTTLSTFPSLIPLFQDIWGITNSEAGTISGIYYGGLLLSVTVLTAWTDRIDAKRVFVVCLGLGFLSGLGFAFLAEGTWSAGLWRLLQGLALGGTYVPGLKILTDRLETRYHSRATSFYTATYYLASGLSYYLAITLESWIDWRWTFGLCALGPLLAMFLAGVLIPPLARAKAKPAHRMFDYRPVLKNRQALGFAIVYGIHNAELVAFSSWLVPFLVFSIGLQSSGAAGIDWDLGVVAALISVIALPSSILFNELAHRLGRQTVIIGVMLVSAAIGVMWGAMAALPFAFVVAMAFAYSASIAADSSTTTAGVVQAAEPGLMGTTMSLYSIIGFSGAFVGPVIFGVVLDLSGGEGAQSAWLMAFLVMAVLMLVGPVVVWRLIGLRPVFR